MLALIWPRVSAWAVGAGLVAGECAAAYALHVTSGPWGINPGFIALLINVVIVTSIALLFPRRTALAASSTTG